MLLELGIKGRPENLPLLLRGGTRGEGMDHPSTPQAGAYQATEILGSR